MKEFIAKLLVSEEYKENKVVIQTNDQDLGQDLLDYIYEFSSESKDLIVKTQKGTETIPENNIIYFEVFGREITIHHTKGETVVRMPLTKILSYLDKMSFQQISKSAVINLKYLTKLEVAFSGNYYGYLGQEKIVVSRRYLKALKERLNVIGGSKDGMD